MNTKNNLEKLNGVIIKELDYRDYDKLLTILTKEKGKIMVYAFNVRKQNSKNIGKTRVFSFGTFELRVSGDRYQLENVILKNSFSEITNDYNNTCYASYFIELADYFGFENLESEKIYILLYYTFKALVDGKVEAKLIRRIFELKMLQYQGEYKESDSLSSDDKTLAYAWNFVLNTLPKKLYSFALNDKVYNLFDKEIGLEMKSKVNKKFKTLNELLD
ncbi:MAG: DNA repair protein RecO [Lachnospiraceae bacterium]|nr:DNA repair protein RecO [Lachnospiraceae bacterium]